MTDPKDIAEDLMQIEDSARLSASIRDHLSDINAGTISYFFDMRKCYLEKGDLHNAWKVSLILYAVSSQNCAPLNIIGSLDKLLEVLALITSQALNEGRQIEAKAYASQILDGISGIYSILKKHVPSSPEKMKEDLLVAGLDVFAKYRLLGLGNDLPDSNAEEPGIQAAIQNLHDNGIFELMIRDEYKHLRLQLGKLLIEYAEGNLRHDLLQQAQSLAISTIRLLENSEFKKEMADAYNLLGRIYQCYSDSDNLLRAIKCFKRSSEILEEINLKKLAAVDHQNISGIYVRLHEWFKENPPEPENYLDLSEIELNKASELGAGELQLLQCRANILQQKGDLDGARNCWNKVIDSLKDEASCIKELLSSEQIQSMSLFISAVINIVQSYFSPETEECTNPAILKDENLLDNLISADKIIKLHPEILGDISHMILLHITLGRIFSSKDDWIKAYPHYKHALRAMESHFERALNLQDKLVLGKRFEYIFDEFIECCGNIGASKQKYTSKCVSDMYWGIANSRQRHFLCAVSLLPLNIPDNIKASIPSELIMAENELLNKAKNSLLKDPGAWSDHDYILAKKTMDELNRIWNCIDKYFPEYISLRHATPLGIEEVLGLLEDL